MAADRQFLILLHGQRELVEATSYTVNDGVLDLDNGTEVVATFAPGEWTGVIDVNVRPARHLDELGQAND